MSDPELAPAGKRSAARGRGSAAPRLPVSTTCVYHVRLAPPLPIEQRAHRRLHVAPDRVKLFVGSEADAGRCPVYVPLHHTYGLGYKHTGFTVRE